MNESFIEMVESKSLDLIIAMYGNGSVEARMRGTETVVASAKDLKTLGAILQAQYPDGFTAEVRYDPHM